jgi:addiction module RelE/StbE family toxin
MPQAGAALTTVVWSKSALTHLTAIRAYIEQFNPHAAGNVAVAIIEAGNSLAIFPYRGRQVPGTENRELLTIYPYIIRYRVVGTVVRILRVRHTSRQPTTHK